MLHECFIEGTVHHTSESVYSTACGCVKCEVLQDEYTSFDMSPAAEKNKNALRVDAECTYLSQFRFRGLCGSLCTRDRPRQVYRRTQPEALCVNYSESDSALMLERTRPVSCNELCPVKLPVCKRTPLFSSEKVVARWAK